MINSLRKDRILMATNYALYYGFGRAEELSRFDIAIIEPKGVSKEEIKYIQSKNTLVLTYVSIIEVHPSEGIFKELQAEDFLLVDGERVTNDEYGTYLVNLQSKKWVNYLLKQVRNHFNQLDSDGIFMDTIGDIEMTGIPETVRQEQLTAIMNLLYALRMLYPNHLFIQNNGLNTVCLTTAPYIDGICWENPPLNLLESKLWVEVILERLNQLKEKYGIKVFLLLEESVETERRGYFKAKKVARENNYLLYRAPLQYVTGVNVMKG